MSRTQVECHICGALRWVYDRGNETPRVCITCQITNLQSFLNPPGSWVSDGLCGQVDPELFYPPPNSRAEQAKAVCAKCEARTACLAYALENEERWGVWGGMTAEERRQLKKGSAA